MVTVGSLRELHKTGPFMLGTLHHLGVLDFVVTEWWQHIQDQHSTFF
jgi:hypothetical protein